MKTLENGVLTDSDGPPLEHEEWVEETLRLQTEEQKERDRASKARTRAKAPAKDDADAHKKGDDAKK